MYRVNRVKRMKGKKRNETKQKKKSIKFNWWLIRLYSFELCTLALKHISGVYLHQLSAWNIFGIKNRWKIWTKKMNFFLWQKRKREKCLFAVQKKASPFHTKPTETVGILFRENIFFLSAKGVADWIIEFNEKVIFLINKQISVSYLPFWDWFFTNFFRTLKTKTIFVNSQMNCFSEAVQCMLF